MGHAIEEAFLKGALIEDASHVQVRAETVTGRLLIAGARRFIADNGRAFREGRRACALIGGMRTNASEANTRSANAQIGTIAIHLANGAVRKGMVKGMGTRSICLTDIHRAIVAVIAIAGCVLTDTAEEQIALTRAALIIQKGAHRIVGWQLGARAIGGTGRVNAIVDGCAEGCIDGGRAIAIVKTHTVAATMREAGGIVG